jgi:hypothetical protein
MPVSVALRKGVDDISRSHLHDSLAKAQSALSSTTCAGRGTLFRSRMCERKVWTGSWPTPFFLRLGGVVPSRPRGNWSWGRVEILNGGEKVTLTKAFFATLSLVVMATSASAEVVCNREGDCWHVREHAWIRPEHGLTIYPHDWKWEEHERERYRWREHEGEGRGYWHEGRWIEYR